VAFLDEMYVDFLQMLFSRLPKTNPLHIVDWSKVGWRLWRSLVAYFDINGDKMMTTCLQLKTRAPIISAAAVIEVGFMIMTTIMMLIFGSLLH
jgi:hypothetical protein